MKYLILPLIALLASSCMEAQIKKSATARTLKTSMYNSSRIDPELAKEKPYEIIYWVEESESPRLITDMKLFGGSFFVSPHSTGDFSGKFRIELEEQAHLKLGNDFTETPRSEEVIDPHPFVNGPVNWVTEYARYEHPITLLTEEDFSVHGKYVFTIEPKCTLEEIPFVIKLKEGKLWVEKWGC